MERFAKNPADPHLKAWQRFNQSIGADGSVGIWHETYLIEPGRYKAIYGNMPVFGLAAALLQLSTSQRWGAKKQLAVPWEVTVSQLYPHQQYSLLTDN